MCGFPMNACPDFTGYQTCLGLTGFDAIQEGAIQI
jgi:hypothetical protein